MSQSTDSNESIVFVGEQYKVSVDVHPPKSPPNPGNNVPETQVSGGGQPQTTAEDHIVIPETQMPITIDTTNPTGTGKNSNYTFNHTTFKIQLKQYFGDHVQATKTGTEPLCKGNMQKT